MQASDENHFSKIKNHIVVCGIHSAILHFILPLRANYLGDKQQDIVIISPFQTIPIEIWETINRFPRIYLISGSPLFTDNLKKA